MKNSGAWERKAALAIATISCGALLGSGLPARAADWRLAPGPLMTRWSKEVSPTNALPEYPRPQMTRTQWQNLNGLWDYAVTPKSAANAPGAYDGQILVPYPIESALSGVMKAFLPTQRLWYRRTFTVPADWKGKNLLLHFGAVDWDTEVFLNGKSLGTHRGGYDAFDFDITKDVKEGGPQEIVVSVLDPTDEGWQLRGKQVLHPGGAAYTATSGIWQTVWIEPVSPDHIESLKIVTDAGAGVLHLTVSARIKPGQAPVSVAVSSGASVVATAKATLGAEMSDEAKDTLRGWYKATSALTVTTLDIPIPKAHLWSPDDPFLYSITVTLNGEQETDTVTSYAGVRSLRTGKDEKGNMRLYLNGKVTMLPMALDQGFWPDGIYTAPTDEALRFDLEAFKKLGLYPRKHIKIEPERWYYWADKLGILVLQDMPAGNEGDSYTDSPKSPEAAMQCESEMRTLIQQRWNHPSIISWNMFNEGWGQYNTVATAAWAKQLDPTRLIDEASGFPRHGAGDILDVHGGIPPKSDHEISIDTENGSVGLASPGHDWPIGQLWTPQTFDPATGGAAPPKDGKLAIVDDASKQWFTRHVRGMFRGLWANADSTGQTGDSYCQITDVETEEDGLISYDRAIWKVDPAPIRAAARGEGRAQNVTPLIPTAQTEPAEWSYTTNTPADNWFAPSFRAAGWQTGKSVFGAGVGKVATPWTTSDIWLRKEFTLASTPKAPLLSILHDEDFKVYLNGVLADQEGGYNGSYDDFEIDPKAAATLKPGKNVIAVYCHQTTGGQGIDVGLFDRK
ncbi:glycoside hydrolase family 2 protein [Capsulimonas corticalis]|nr:sugar-binding domain-containing protein [Capsulimonas corticalis]